MKTIAETKRLFIREFSLGDAKCFYDLNNDPEVMRYTGDKPFRSIEESQLLINNYDAYKKNGFGRNTLILKESNEIIGWCGLKRHEEGMVDLGFRLFQKYWNKGYATEASLKHLELGFNTYQIEEIIGRASHDNLASIAVLKKCGMKFWKNAPCEGIENSVYYRIQKRDFRV